MGARSTASSQSGREGSASRSSSALFADSYKSRRASGFALAIVILSAAGACALMLYWYLGATDYSGFPIVGQAIAGFDRSAMFAVACVAFASCAPIGAIAILMRRCMPMRYEIVNDFVRGMQSCGVIPADLKSDEIKWKVRIRRFQRKAEIRFLLRYPNRSYEDMLPMVAGMRTAFRRSTGVVPDRAGKPYAMALVVYYGDGIDG